MHRDREIYISADICRDNVSGILMCRDQGRLGKVNNAISALAGPFCSSGSSMDPQT